MDKTTTTPKILTCPVCDGQLQATREMHEWLSMGSDGKFEEKDADCVELRFYCENDHTLGDGDWDDDFQSRIYKIWAEG